MLISPKWQTMWMESQYCSKSIMNAPPPSQQAERVLEDLRAHCCSPNKEVQLEALKCWGMWIHNQKPDDWKLNTVCFAAVRPLLSKKVQPLHKDADICTVKLSLMWALLVKVQNIIHLEGPQYILEMLLQSCLTWLSSVKDDGCENYITSVVFQLLLRLFKKDEILNDLDKDMFPPLTVDVLHSNKIFHRLAEKFLEVFVYRRRVQEKTVILKLWKHFLDHCERSREHIPFPIWHKIFKQAGQICSDQSESVKERLAFLHGCATTLKTALSSSKFIDFGNLLTTPCEALLKKLVELCCTVIPDERCDSEMFFHSKEICEVLAVKSVALGGYALCINVLDILEEFWLPDLFWGVWCGLVHCYKVLMQDIDKSQLTKLQTKFYRKLRGVAINFELDRNNLHKDCINEVEEHIGVLNISCMCASHMFKNTKDPTGEKASIELMDTGSLQPSESPPTNQSSPEEISNQIVQLEPTRFYGKFSNIVVHNRALPRRTINVNVDLIKDILTSNGVNFPKFNWLNCAFSFRFIKFETVDPDETVRLPRSRSLRFKPALEHKEGMNLPCIKSETLSRVPECDPAKKSGETDETGGRIVYETEEETGDRIVHETGKETGDRIVHETEMETGDRIVHETEEEEEAEAEVEDTVSIPLTRSRRVEEEKKELERRMRRKRRSFEVLVQEILKKNKERKTEKNSKKKITVSQKGKRNKKKLQKSESKPPEVSDRQLRNRKKKEPKKEKTSKNTDGKLENYFKVLTKKSEKEGNKENKKRQNKKKGKEKKKENSCCKPEKEERQKKGEIGWRQTSLKTMMNQKGQIHGRLRARNKVSEGTNKMAACPLADLSPFKEVLHDHEYVKIDPQSFRESVLLTPQKRKTEKREPEDEQGSKPESNKPEVSVVAFSEVKSEGLKVQVVQTEPLQRPGPEVAVFEKQETHEMPCANQMQEGDTRVELTEEKTPTELRIVEEILIKRGIKRTRTDEDHVPNKRIKLEEEDNQEEKLPLEVTEKENLEERHSPRGKTGCSTLNTMSRALRMIALVPESTKGGQIQRESLPRVEVLKCKKGPNVDRGSRASKMLALLSENAVEVEDVSEINMEDITSWGGVTTTPDAQKPVSSMKSPKSIKKRRSIRFDDARNETVLYQTDTPPSQILEEKAKSRRIQLAKITVNLP